MSRPVARRLAVAGVAAGCVAAAAAPALAEPALTDSQSSATVTYSVQSVSGTRQLALYGMDGQVLDSLDLRPGVPAPFRVEVKDTQVGDLTSVDDLGQPNSGFTVSAVLNNLYLGGSPTAADNAVIPSSNVSVGFPADGARNVAATVRALPDTLISATLGGCTGSLISSLGLNILNGVGLSLCNALSSGRTLTDVRVPLSSAQSLLDLPVAPFALTGQQGGPFTAPDYSFGPGLADARGAAAGGGRKAGTPVELLKGIPDLAAMAGRLTSLDATLEALPALSADGTGAQASVVDLVGVLQETSGLTDLGSALAGLTTTQVLTLLQGATGDVEPVDLGDVQELNGTYNSLPVLTAAAATGVLQGDYSGQMTVTLVQP